ncbi:hypothetical protein SAMN04489859_102023 [Paracoccus alcaliphilus]|uniref:Uncharacterized protein n=1 Tax=Paracoccus alcaliphilus TaxID=34002 RepID=A0A1H8K4E0_9RHOB|nr:hypothetical protein [Paracoccus alcaliphilus]WCR17520.1 hypothetical protein JHW40_14450 [Paracoccus alcaliphilus]SEN87278.1 hypothetical protein SAMN04489859_102023 [Paracoccus alcaliphilus]
MTDQNTPDALDLTGADDDALKAMGLPASFTLDSLKDHLEPEEIARLAEGDDPITTLPDEKAEDSAVSDDDGGDDDGETDDEAKDEGDGEGDDDNAAQEGEEEAAQADDTPDPVFQPTDVSAEQAIVDAAATKRKELREAYSDGDMTDEEYDEQLDALNDKIAEAKAAIKTAERQDEQALKGVQEVWFGKTKAFMDAHPAFADNTAKQEYGGDSSLVLFDRALRVVTGRPEYAKLSMDQKIEIGARMVRDHIKSLTGEEAAEFSLKKPGKAPKTTDKQAKGETEAGKAADKADPLGRAKEAVEKQGKRRQALQTLANVSAATDIDASDGRFSAIDRADGLEAEAAFESMSKAEQEAYLRGA